MRFILPLLGVMGLAACDPPVPDSAAGVGFSDYSQYMQNREAQLRGQGGGIVPPPQVTTVAGTPVRTVPTQGPAPQPAQTQTAGAPLSAIPGLSDPPDPAFAQDDPDSPQALARAALDSVAPSGGVTGQPAEPAMSREAAETDAERQERLRAEYQVVEPSELPERPGDAPNIVAYALNTTNAVGQSIHRRSAIQLRSHERACAQFASQDLAQEEFLRRGGPERDPLNLDPDGDGFACWWDPEPFRAAARAARQE
jgi:hypothetical protein